MKSLVFGGALVAAATSLVLGQTSLATAAPPSGPPFGQSPTVFVQTNNPAGNQVIVFAQQPNGQLSQEETVSTGGLGAGSAGANNLASEGSLTYDPEHHLLFAVNAGSDTISVLSVYGRIVRLDQVLSSGGEFPNSIAVHGNVAYVLNAGGPGSVSGFYIFGQFVVPIPGSTRSLGLENTVPPGIHTSPGQVGFSSDGSDLLVTTKQSTNSVDVFTVGPFGFLSAAPTANPDGSNAPFAFTWTPSGQLVVAELGPDALHTFSLGSAGTLDSLSGSVSDGQSALCWVIAADGFYYGANAGSGDLSSYTVAADGVPSLLSAVAATTGAGQIDPVASASGRYLYAESGAGGGSVFEFQINSDGSLSPIGSVTGLGANMEGIAAD
jgi:hypothetical protein